MSDSIPADAAMADLATKTGAWRDVTRAIAKWLTGCGVKIERHEQALIYRHTSEFLDELVDEIFVDELSEDE